MNPPGIPGTVVPDYRSLLALSRQGTADTLAGYAVIGRALFGGEKAGLTDRERALTSSVLRRLVADVEAAILRALDGMSGDDKPVTGFAPRADTYQRIAAMGILQDAALIEAVQHRIGEFRLESAITDRLSDRWSEADSGDERGAIEALAGGAGQLVRDRLNDYMAARATRTDAYDNPLLPLGEPDIEVMRRLYWAVAATMRPSMLTPPATGEPRVDSALERAVLEALESLASERARPSRAAAAADALADAGRLDSGHVVDALRRGEVQLFTVMFCRLSGMRRALVCRLMFEPGGTGLAIACKACGMARADFGEVYLLTRNAREIKGAGADVGVQDIMTWFDRLPHGEAAKVVAYWRRPADYLRALWLSEQGNEGGAGPD